MKKVAITIVLFALIMVLPAGVWAHCEIPCGIYDDGMRIQMIREDIATIEKSMNAIQTIEKAKDHDANQLVRWIMNKEEHADKIQDIVAQYFMTQRIKPEMKNYTKQLEILHQMLIYSMKCKQTTDLSNVETLKSVVADFEKLYFEKK